MASFVSSPTELVARFEELGALVPEASKRRSAIAPVSRAGTCS